MLDEELRRLERDPTERIRYAEALTRLGRTEDALEVLLASIEEPGVREALRSLAPVHVPIEAPPRVAWTYSETMEDMGGLHANAIAVVASVHNISHSWPPYTGGAPESLQIDVLSPVTGKRRASIGGLKAIALVDEVVIATEEAGGPGEWRGLVAGFDVRDGRELWRLELGEQWFFLAEGRTLFAFTSASYGARRIEPRSLEDPRKTPPKVAASAELPNRDRRKVVIGDVSYELRDDDVVARRGKDQLWVHRAGAWYGHLATAGRRLVVSAGRGAAVVCLESSV